MNAYIVCLVLSVPNSVPTKYKASAGIRLAEDDKAAGRVFYLDTVEMFPEFTQIESLNCSEIQYGYLVQLINRMEK